MQSSKFDLLQRSCGLAKLSGTQGHKHFDIRRPKKDTSFFGKNWKCFSKASWIPSEARGAVHGLPKYQKAFFFFFAFGSFLGVRIGTPSRHGTRDNVLYPLPLIYALAEETLKVRRKTNARELNV